jgi:putative acetyltransferase
LFVQSLQPKDKQAMIQNDIQIRRVRPQDAAAITQLVAEPEVFGNLLQMPFPSEASWSHRLTQIPTDHSVQLIAERQGQVVGSAGLHANGSHVRRHHAMGLGIWVAAKAQGQGVGSALMQALIDYADQWAHVLRIELTVYTDNTRAIALYERFGFESEGRHRAYALRQGVYSDVLAMARLHPNPPRWS